MAEDASNLRVLVFQTSLLSCLFHLLSGKLTVSGLNTQVLCTFGFRYILTRHRIFDLKTWMTDHHAEPTGAFCLNLFGTAKIRKSIAFIVMHVITTGKLSVCILAHYFKLKAIRNDQGCSSGGRPSKAKVEVAHNYNHFLWMRIWLANHALVAGAAFCDADNGPHIFRAVTTVASSSANSKRFR